MTTPNHGQVAWKMIPAVVRSCPLTRDSGTIKRVRNSEWLIAALFSGSRWPHPLPMPPSPNLRKKKRKWECCSVAGDDCWHSTHSFSTQRQQKVPVHFSPPIPSQERWDAFFQRCTQSPSLVCRAGASSPPEQNGAKAHPTLPCWWEWTCQIQEIPISRCPMGTSELGIPGCSSDKQNP